jgi:hypothetical protein
MAEPIPCESRITRVVVYARGAVVTRIVELPAGLPSEGCELVVNRITPMAEPGSIRTGVDGERAVTGVQAPIYRPEGAALKSIDQDAVRVKQQQARRVQLRSERVSYRINYLLSMSIHSDLSPPKRRHDEQVPGVNQRLDAAMGTADLVHGLLSDLEAEQNELAARALKLAEEIRDLQVRPSPAKPSSPQRQVRISLAPGSEHLRALEISYNVSAARWWPAYAARLTNGGKQTEFAVEAFVAQQTLEDWREARISLCTADMISDLTLPELQSLRLGRRQEPKRSGFREPPEGLDAMFEAHDAAFGGPETAPEDARVYAEAPDEDDDYISDIGEVVGASAEMMEEYVMDDVVEPATPRRSRGGRANKKMARQEVAMSAPPQSAPAPAGKAGSAASSYDMLRSGDELVGEAIGGGAMRADEPEPQPQGVDEQWLDYDSLALAAPQSARRGRLAYNDSSGYPQGSRFRQAVESADEPRGAADPLYTRGMFDHQFDADGLVEITSNGKPQRVRLMAKPAKSRMTFRCVPLEDERVFREVEIENPLEAPLLPGPVDVFMDGALLITSEVDAVDRGGTIRFGLGEEQRVRVARNVRAREETKGVFGGKIAMDHEVTFEAASSLGGDIELELVDRLPVTSDKDIDIELLKSEPKADRYSQDERDSHVKGGLRWRLPLKAGATAKVLLAYRIGFDKDFELLGGNRRD